MNPFGVRTREQLLATGIPSSTIAARCRSGRYQRLLPGVYVLGEPTKLARCFAVTQWQPFAMVSHRTAAWLYGWLDEPEIVEATVPRRVKVVTPKWLRLYRRDLEDAVAGEVSGIPSVTRDQALHDCISVLPLDEADRLVDQQLTRTVSVESMRSLVETNPGRRGNRDTVRQLREAAVLSLSEPERILARVFSGRGFEISANSAVGPFFGDFVDERARLVVEVDGREFHSEPEVFRKDRRRQNWMVNAGWMVLRYAAADIFTDPDAIADEVIAIVTKRRNARR